MKFKIKKDKDGNPVLQYPYADGGVWEYDSEFIVSHSKELAYASENDIPLMNFQEWCHLNDILKGTMPYRRISYETYEDFASAVEGTRFEEILSLTKEDAEVIVLILSEIQKKDGHPKNLLDRLEGKKLIPDTTGDPVDDCNRYLQANFDMEDIHFGSSLCYNILLFVKEHAYDATEAKVWLDELLDGIGIEDREMKQIAKRLKEGETI